MKIRLTHLTQGNDFCFLICNENNSQIVCTKNVFQVVHLRWINLKLDSLHSTFVCLHTERQWTLFFDSWLKKPQQILVIFGILIGGIFESGRGGEFNYFCLVERIAGYSAILPTGPSITATVVDYNLENLVDIEQCHNACQSKIRHSQ